jgi:hypothetical protein
MKNLITKQNLIILGVGLATAFFVYKVLVNGEKESKTTKTVSKEMDETSSFCGCGA